MVSTDPKFVQRLLPHVSALISGAAAYLSLGLFPDREETGFLAVAATFALVGIPVLGAAVGSLIADRRNIRLALRPYVLATLWMWGLSVVLAAVVFAVEDGGLIPTDTPAEGIVASLLYLGITIVFIWPWFIVPTAQIVHTIRTRTDSPTHRGVRGALVNIVFWIILGGAAVVGVYGLVGGLLAGNSYGAISFLFFAGLMAVLALLWRRSARDTDDADEKPSSGSRDQADNDR